jgi:glutathione synthase/RimK-type ligase-like ATP-grasp enzyme
VSHVLLLTAEALPSGAQDADTAPLAAALLARGAGTTVLPWTAPTADWPPDVDLAIVRSTWDYTTRLPQFLAFLDGLSIPIANPAAVIRWNSHKGYLAELAEHGVPVVPVVLIRQGEPAIIPDMGAATIVVKPAVSAGARGVGLFPADSLAAPGHLAQLLLTGDALIQPFQPSVHDGERSLIFFGGKFSHAVRKIPAAGDFRVQPRHGGRNVPHAPTDDELWVAEQALASIDVPLLYARVDMVAAMEGPLLMELELIEPAVFLDVVPEAADRLATAVLAAL